MKQEKNCPNCDKNLKKHTKKQFTTCNYQWQGKMELEPYNYGN